MAGLTPHPITAAWSRRRRLKDEAMSLEALSYARPELLRDVLGIPLGKALLLLVAVAQCRAAAL
eukprot:7960107-Alexandrium_andersonii.AAC.1